MDIIAKSTRLFYDTYASEFSLRSQHNWPPVRKVIQKLASKAKILDLGCGHGRLLEDLSPSIEYTGIDFSKELLGIAQKSYPGKKFIYGDLVSDSTHKDKDPYGAIFCIAVLHHFPTNADHIFLLKKIKSLLKKDGIALISYWQLFRSNTIKYHLLSLPAKLKNWHHLYLPYHGTEKRFFYCFTPNELPKLCKQVGLKVIHQETYKNNCFLELTKVS